jgi:hypothetical protein
MRIVEVIMHWLVIQGDITPHWQAEARTFMLGPIEQHEGFDGFVMQVLSHVSEKKKSKLAPDSAPRI